MPRGFYSLILVTTKYVLVPQAGPLAPTPLPLLRCRFPNIAAKLIAPESVQISQITTCYITHTTQQHEKPFIPFTRAGMTLSLGKVGTPHAS